MRYKMFLVFGLVLGLSLSACQKVIDLKLNNKSGQYVIEGNVTNLPGPYTVRIGKTEAVTTDYVFQGVGGASVVINGETLVEVQPGVFETRTLKGAEGQAYSLSVSVDGKVFTATSTMPHLVPLDSLYIDQVYNFSKLVKVLVPVFTDPVGQGNCYKMNQTINGVLDKTLYYQNDDFSDGKTTYFAKLRPDPDSTLRVNDHVSLEMQCIDKAMYKYWYSLDMSATGDGDGVPANPVTNITGGALGYFSAHTSQTKSIIVK